MLSLLGLHSSGNLRETIAGAAAPRPNVGRLRLRFMAIYPGFCPWSHAEHLASAGTETKGNGARSASPAVLSALSGNLGEAIPGRWSRGQMLDEREGDAPGATQSSWPRQRRRRKGTQPALPALLCVRSLGKSQGSNPWAVEPRPIAGRTRLRCRWGRSERLASAARGRKGTWPAPSALLCLRSLGKSRWGDPWAMGRRGQVPV